MNIMKILDSKNGPRRMVRGMRSGERQAKYSQQLTKCEGCGAWCSFDEKACMEARVAGGLRCGSCGALL